MNNRSTSQSQIPPHIVVLGAGAHSRAHGAALQTLKAQDPASLDLSAICDLDVDKAREYQALFGFGAVYTDLDEMIECEQPDGLITITPVTATEQLSVTLLPRGIPMVIEKPAGASSNSARQILDCANEHGTPHMISYNRRFSPALIKVREWIAADPAHRQPAFVLARMLRHNRHEPDFATGTGIHLVDAVLSILGHPHHVSTVKTPAASDQCAHYYARLSFDNNAMAECIIAPDAGVLEETYEIHGPEYCAHVDTQQCSVRIILQNEVVLDWQAPPDSPACFRGGTMNETAAFLDLIQGRPDAVLPTLDDALAGLLTAEAIAHGGDVEV